MKPNYKELGWSDKMGPKLRALVEEQLIEDLRKYELIGNQFKFDWSESCIEGHDAVYLDGEVENFSGIKVFNEKDELIAEGWMKFIHEPAENFFIAYWEFLSFFEFGKARSMKDKVGIPLHIFKRIPKNSRFRYKDEVVE
ncbi:hypothetical protein FZC66_17540 [Priestia megaterium]|nr:hypothetical protein FZC66_17540 [Priestia megaterium]